MNPGKYNYGSPGAGTLLHVATERMKQVTGAEIAHADGLDEFVRAEDRSGDFDVKFVLGATTSDDLDGLGLAEAARRSDVELRAVFDN